MPGENVELVRRWMEATAVRDLETMLEIADPEIEAVPIMAALEGRVYRGHEGIRQWMEDLFEHWEVFEPILEDWREHGDTIIGFGRWNARGRASGTQLVGQQAVWLFTFRDGQLTRLRTYTSREEALVELGL